MQLIKLSDLKHIVEDDTSCVELKKECSQKFQLLPGQFNDIKKSVKENLYSAISKYDSHLGGIILNFKNVKIKPLVSLTEDINVNVNYISDVYVFRPQVNKILKGIINKKSQDHIGCLIHKYFNATISRPNDVSLENWSGSHLNIGDEIQFRISHVNLDRKLPYIRGSLEDSDNDIQPTESVSTERISYTGQVLNSSTSITQNICTPTSSRKIEKIINPNYISSDEESTNKRKRSSMKESPNSHKLSEKDKSSFKSKRATSTEDGADQPSKKRRKIHY